MDIVKVREKLKEGKSIYDLDLRVVNYNRVSTEKIEQLNSLTNQANYFNDLIASVKTWQHVGSYVDEGISGTQVFKRENFLKMINDAKEKKFDLIVTKEISRFARNTIDSINYTELLLKYGVAVYFISDNLNTIYPDSEFRLTLMASLAQDEVRKLSERVKFGIKRSIKDGKVGGTAPYGYRKEKCCLIINEEESPAIQKLFSLYASRKYGLKKIGLLLADSGYYTRKGSIFSDATLKKMLTNPKYKGYYTANMSETVDYKTKQKRKKDECEWVIYKDHTKVPPLVSETLWNEANRIYKSRKHLQNKNNLNKEEYLNHKSYTSKLICQEHNTFFIKSASGKRKTNPVWHCNEYLRYGLKGCTSPRIFEKNLTLVLKPYLLKILGDTETIIMDLVNDYEEMFAKNNLKKHVFSNKEQISKIKIKQNRLLDLLLNNTITNEMFLTKNADLELKLTKLETTSLDTSQTTFSKNSIQEELLKILKSDKTYFECFSLFISKIIVSKINNSRTHLNLNLIFTYGEEDNLEITT